MPYINNSDAYNIEDASVLDWLIGSDFSDTKKTKIFQIQALFELYKTYVGTIDIQEYDIDAVDYDYYGGLYNNSKWIINRYNKLDVTNKKKAIFENNLTYITFTDAWNDKANLIYI